jgi:putative nucleotidyltransferase with HDIG domain
MKSKAGDRQKQDDAYIAGILHDIGKLVLFESPGYYKNLREIMLTKDISYTEAEIELLGTSHAEVGAYLLSLWGMPEEIVEAVAFHHAPSKLNDMEFTVLSAVHIANALEYVMPHIDTKHLKYLDMSANLVEFIDILK